MRWSEQDDLVRCTLVCLSLKLRSHWWFNPNWIRIKALFRIKASHSIRFKPNWIRNNESIRSTYSTLTNSHQDSSVAHLIRINKFPFPNSCPNLLIIIYAGCAPHYNMQIRDMCSVYKSPGT
jgi:hypothetical protein